MNTTKSNALRQHLEAIKEMVRQPYAWPGGYEKIAVTSDGALLCHKCIKGNYLSIYEDTRDNINSGWCVYGITLDCEMEHPEEECCAHCNSYFEEATE